MCQSRVNPVLTFLLAIAPNYVYNFVHKRGELDVGNFYRIQDKIVSKQKIDSTVSKILEMRSRGFSQQEVADRLKVDRTFISRLESIGEIRKGSSIAVVGFPILNKGEIEEVLRKEGVDFYLLMTEEERIGYVQERSGAELLNELMNLIGEFRKYDVVVCIGSDFRIKLVQGILDNEVIGIEIGESPLTEDKWVDPAEVKRVLAAIKSARR